MVENESILIVDDDESTRKGLSLIFGKRGYATETAATGREGIEKAQGKFFNLALLDIKLPDMEGVELLSPLKQMHPDMKVIMATAHASLDTAVQAVNAGASAYITKPLDMDQVLIAVREVLEKQRLVMENKSLYQAAQRELLERKQAEDALHQRLAELTVLHAVAAAGAEATDLDTLIERATEVIGKTLYPDNLGLVLVNEADGSLRSYPSYRSPGGNEIEIRTLPKERGIVGQVVATGQPWRVPDVTREPAYLPINPNTRSELCAPLIVGERVIGAINAESMRLDAFGEVDEQLMITFAGQLATAIEKVRLFQAEREQRELAETLTEVTLALTSHTSLTAVLDEILRQVQRLVPYRTAHIMLLQDETLRAACWQGYQALESEEHIAGLVQRLADLPLDAEVIRSRQPLIVYDTHRDPRWVVFNRTAWVRSHLAIPICLRERVLGLLRLDGGTPGEFSVEDAMRLYPLTNAAAIAIENAHLLESAQRRAEEAETLRQAGATLIETLSLDETLHRILEQLERVVSYDSASVQLLREGHLEIVGGRLFADLQNAIGFTIPVPGDNPNTTVIQERRAEIVEQPHAAYSEFCVPRNGAVQSWLGVPLTVRAQVIGMLALNSLEPGHFTQDHVRLVTPFANQAAIAIENARLVEGLEAEVAAQTAEIRAEKEKCETILRNVGDAILMAGPEMQIQYVNDAFTALTGYTAEEVIGQHANSVGAKAPDQVRRAIETSLAEGKAWRGEMIGYRKDGRSYDAALTIAPMRDAEGRLVGHVSTHRDISRMKELERARRQFITNVSHQLRTPVTNFKLYVRLLRTGRRPERVDHYLQVLAQETGRLEHLVEDILEMITLDSNHGAMSWGIVSLPTVIGDAITRYQSRAEASGLALVAAAIPLGTPQVKGDQARLTRALNELVENAVNFTPAGGQVIVETGVAEEEGQRWVTLAVRDTGPGISPEEQEHIFERFFRGSLAESGHVSGTGLGLSIVQEILHAHGGRVMVDSKIGQGSTFQLWLPAAQET